MEEDVVELFNKVAVEYNDLLVSDQNIRIVEKCLRSFFIRVMEAVPMKTTKFSAGFSMISIYN